MLVFKNKPFARFAEKNGITDADLCWVVAEANRGLIDADLGGGVIKQRLARKGEGKSGGFRTIILFRLRGLAIFVHGFAKNDKANLNREELVLFRKLASKMLAYRIENLISAVAEGVLVEVICDGE